MKNLSDEEILNYIKTKEPQDKAGAYAIQGLASIFIEKINGCYIGVRRVLTNLFGSREVLAYVTTPEKDFCTRRLFFSTIFPEQLQIFCAWQEKAPLNQTGSE